MTASNPERTRVPPKSPGRAIKARRQYLGMRQEDVVAATNGVISDRLLSRLENDHQHPSSLRLRKYQTLREVLQWTAEEMARETGAPPVESDLPGAAPYRPTLEVPIVGTVSAGLAALGEPMSETSSIPMDPNLGALRGVNPNDLIAMKVNGDSMVSERAARRIPPESYVIVEVGAAPADGNIVVAWLPSRDTAVLKEYRETEGMLRSYNPAGPSFLAKDEPIEVRGVVRAIVSYP